MVIFTFFVSYQKSPFWANLVQKIKVSLTPSESTPRLEAPFFGKFGPTNRNSQLKLKFGTQINSNMQNSTAVFIIFFFFTLETPFLPSLRPHGSRDFEICSCCQHGFFMCTALKTLNNLKRKQTFCFHINQFFV